MKIIVTGSLGNISKPLTGQLITNGHNVTVISSKADKKQAIEETGAKAAIGSMNDVAFLTETFAGADAVYLMESMAPNSFFDPNVDVVEAVVAIGRNYKQAIEAAGVKKVIHLSSIGADKEDGNGMLTFHYKVEQILSQLPADVHIKFMRPVGFYYNLLAFIPSIKGQGAIFSNYGGDEKEPWVSPLDIAAVVVEEFDLPFDGREVRYIASDEFSPNELTAALREATNKPDLQWITVADDQFLDALVKAGMNPQTAKGYTEMNAARRGGKLYEHYLAHHPQLGKVKLADYMQTFTAIYQQQ